MALHHVAGAGERDVAMVREARRGARRARRSGRFRSTARRRRSSTGHVMRRQYCAACIAPERIGAHRQVQRIVLPHEAAVDRARAGARRAAARAPRRAADRACAAARRRRRATASACACAARGSSTRRSSCAVRPAELDVGLIGRAEALEQRERARARSGRVPAQYAATLPPIEWPTTISALAREPRDHVVEIGDVVDEVVVAAGADPVAVAVAAQIGATTARARASRGATSCQPYARSRKPWTSTNVVSPRRVPLEDVVREPGREREAMRASGARLDVPDVAAGRRHVQLAARIGVEARRARRPAAGRRGQVVDVTLPSPSNVARTGRPRCCRV